MRYPICRHTLDLLILCFVVLALSGCAGVKVSTIDTEHYMEQRRGDVLTSGELSSYTGSALQVLGLERDLCMEDGEPCRAALYSTRGLTEERRLSSLAELWLHEAMRREKDDEGNPATIAAYLETARFAYAYLFLSERPMQERTLEERPTQVRDYYNFAVQQAIAHLFDEQNSIRKGAEAGAKLAIAGWNISVHLNGRSGTFSQDIVPEAVLPASSLSFDGLRNQYRRDGLGAEMVAVLPENKNKDAVWSQMRYPALTTIAEFPGESLADVLAADSVILHIYDPFSTERISIRGCDIPLAGNFTSGYGLWLARSEFATQSLGTLFGQGDMLEAPHVYLMQPYQPDRKTVIMIHGLASSPEAWINVANEIMGDDKLAREYQIWQVYYPTSFPIPLNNAAIRSAILQTLKDLDPSGKNNASNDILLVGHSMGGILSRLMVSSSGEQLWETLLANRQFDSKLRKQVRDHLQDYLFFEPLPQVGRAVFIAAPHRGTPFADKSIARFIAGLITLPVKIVTGVIEPAIQLVAPELKEKKQPINGIANLSAKDPFIVNAANLPIAPDVPYHSIIGNDTPGKSLAESSDGIVPYSSSHLDGATSEKVIASGHSVQETPEAILEIRRIMHLHLAQ
ncbi:MAG: alpha/beta fold hydrolase [Mailhella sp.]|nr:alpha/beta fold hydrolase [Mailhella sp.]